MVDDELIVSRAKDIKSKSISSRKTRNEGYVADCVASSFTIVMYNLRLRVKCESQEENIEALLSNLPKLAFAHDNI